MALARRNNRERALPRLFSSFADDFFRLPDAWEDMNASPLRDISADVYETDNEVCVEMALPGINPEDITISVSGNVLSISGETSEEEKEERKNYYQRQLRYGSFAQSFVLPASVDSKQVDATFGNGILKITMPKAEEAKAKTIKVKVQE